MSNRVAVIGSLCMESVDKPKLCGILNLFRYGEFPAVNNGTVWILLTVQTWSSFKTMGSLVCALNVQYLEMDSLVAVQLS